VLDARLADILASVKAHGLEGVVAKRQESYYEAGQRSGARQKMRINQGQEFVIGGYTVGGRDGALHEPGHGRDGREGFRPGNREDRRAAA
jgi:ATP-dependent DNA ligase